MHLLANKQFLTLHPRAEQQATLMENQLRAFESKLGAFLDNYGASPEVEEREGELPSASAAASAQSQPAGSSEEPSKPNGA